MAPTTTTKLSRFREYEDARHALEFAWRAASELGLLQGRRYVAIAVELPVDADFERIDILDVVSKAEWYGNVVGGCVRDHVADV